MPKIPVLTLGAALLFAAPQAIFAAPTTSAQELQSSFINVAKTVKPAVVTIICQRRADAKEEDSNDAPTSPSDAPKSSIGTGVIFRADGWILTNYHVVRDSTVIRALIDSDSENVSRAVAQLIGFDEEADLAVIKIKRNNLPIVNFADSDKVQIGQWALAIGSPFDQPQTFTAGIISATGRHLDRDGRIGLQDFLQTDASINPGNSGGPLLDLEGRVMGLNTAILSPSRYSVGIGFSVPSNTIQQILPILMAGKKVERGFLGIQYVRLDENVAKAWGVKGGIQIGALAQKNGASIGPATDAGLLADDIVESVEGAPIETTRQFRALISGKTPGSKIELGVARPTEKGLKRLKITLTLGDRKVAGESETAPEKALPAAPKTSLLGLEVQDAAKLTILQKRDFGFDAKDSGAIITDIAPGGSADEGDLRRGLKIVRARQNGVWKIIENAQNWRELEKSLAPNDNLLLQLRDKDGVSVYKVVVAPAV